MTLADRLLYLLTLLSLPMIFWLLWQPQSQAMQADIHVDGQFIKRVSLEENRTLHISGYLGDSILEIKNGKIRFLDSPCSSKRCVISGWHLHSGDFAACVPNRVSISLLGSSPQQFDSINF